MVTRGTKQYIIPEELLSQIRTHEPLENSVQIGQMKITKDLQIEFSHRVEKWIKSLEIPEDQIHLYVLKMDKPKIFENHHNTIKMKYHLYRKGPGGSPTGRVIASLSTRMDVKLKK